MLPPPIARPGLSFMIGILAFCLVGLLVLAVRSNLTTGKSYEDKRAETRLARLTALRHTEHYKLTTYAWTNKAQGAVQIPIQRAMALTLADLKTQSVAASAVKAEANTTNIVPPSLQTAPPSASLSSAPAPTAK